MITSKGSWFSFKGIKNGAIGVYLLSLPKRTKPKVKGKSLSVAGRNGDIWMPDGSYDVISVKIDLAIPNTLDGNALSAVNDWLNGSGELIFSDEPNRAYHARVDKPISYQTFIKRTTSQKFTVDFTCQPFKYLYPAEPTITTTAMTYTLQNPLLAESAPLIKITTTSTADFTLSLEQDSETVWSADFSGVPTGGIVIDSELLDAFSLDYNAFYNAYMSGEFPKIPVGESVLRCAVDSGTVSKIEITPRWREL